MIAALDAAYRGQTAFGACVLFDDWSDAAPAKVVTAQVEEVEAYIPGAFYKRELPVLLAALRAAGETPEALIVDGYVWLDAAGAPGLGGHLYEARDRAAPVIGVAKTSYREDEWSTRVKRGKGDRPLYVTAAGIDVERAAAHIAAMHGPARVPDMLHLADRAARRAAGI